MTGLFAKPASSNGIIQVLHTTEDTYKVHTHVCIWSVVRWLAHVLSGTIITHQDAWRYCVPPTEKEKWWRPQRPSSHQWRCRRLALFLYSSMHRLRMFSIIVPYRHLVISFYYTHSIMHDNSLVVAVGGLVCDLLTSSDLHFYSLCSFQTTLQERFEHCHLKLRKVKKRPFTQKNAVLQEKRLQRQFQYQ